MSVGVMKDYNTKNKEIYASPIHWVGLGTGTPKDRDEVNKTLDYYSYRLIGKLTAFLQLQEFSLRNRTVEPFTLSVRPS